MIVAPFLPLLIVSNSEILTRLEVFLFVNIAMYSSVGFGDKQATTLSSLTLIPLTPEALAPTSDISLESIFM